MATTDYISSGSGQRSISVRRPAAGILVLTALCAAGVLRRRVAALRKLELSTIDMRMWAWAARHPLTSSPIVVVDINDDSDEVLSGMWPWPRSFCARFIRNLNRAGAL